MGKFATYPAFTVFVASDQLIGVDLSDLTDDATGSTKYLTGDVLMDFINANVSIVESQITDLAHTPEGTAVKSTGELGGTKFLRENGDGTCSWQVVAGGSHPGSADEMYTSDGAGGIVAETNLTFDGSNHILKIEGSTTPGLWMRNTTPASADDEIWVNFVHTNGVLTWGTLNDAELRTDRLTISRAGVLSVGGDSGSILCGRILSAVVDGGVIPLTLVGTFGQTAKLFEVQDENFTPVFSIGPTGGTTVNVGDLTVTDGNVHFGTIVSPTVAGNAVTVDLSASNHQFVDLAPADGTVTITLDAPSGATSGTIVIKQDATARDITWVAGTGITTGRWQGTEPTWSGDTPSLYRVISWAFDGTDIRLAATEEETATF
jgi:hypothetical protein